MLFCVIVGGQAGRPYRHRQVGWPDRGQRSARAWPRSRRVTEVHRERSAVRLPRRTPRRQRGQRKVRRHTGTFHGIYVLL